MRVKRDCLTKPQMLNLLNHLAFPSHNFFFILKIISALLNTIVLYLKMSKQTLKKKTVLAVPNSNIANCGSDFNTQIFCTFQDLIPRKLRRILWSNLHERGLLEHTSIKTQYLWSNIQVQSWGQNFKPIFSCSQRGSLWKYYFYAQVRR